MRERVCAHRHCNVSLEGRRRQCRYCSAACRAAESKLRRADSRAEGEKPHSAVSRPPRRQTRDGRGTRMYVVRDELELVRDVLAGKRPRENGARDRLLQKIPRALEHLDERGAAA